MDFEMNGQIFYWLLILPALMFLMTLVQLWLVFQTKDGEHSQSDGADHSDIEPNPLKKSTPLKQYANKDRFQSTMEE